MALVQAGGPGGPVGQLVTVTDLITGAPVTVLIPAVAIDTTDSGNATAANQVLEIADLDAIKTNTTGASTAANQATSNTALAAIQTAVQSTNPVQTYRSDSYANITTKTTTTVKSGAGTFCGINVNTLGSLDTITIYDNMAGSGTKIGTITSAGVGRLTFDVAFATGLTIVTAGTTAGDYTVSYR